MALPRSLLQYVCGLFLFIAFSQALKFDLQAFAQGDKKGERCIRNFVGRDTLVVVTAIVSGAKGDGMQVNMHVGASSGLGSLYHPSIADSFAQIKDAVGNEYGKPKDIAGEQRVVFTSHADSAFDVCFENVLTGST